MRTGRIEMAGENENFISVVTSVGSHMYTELCYTGVYVTHRSGAGAVTL